MNKLCLKKCSNLLPKTVSVLYLLFYVFCVNANNIDSNLVAKLTNHADAVVEEDNSIININDNSYTYSVHKRIKFNNDNKIDYATLVIGYDKTIEVKFNYGVIYNNYGKEVKRISKSDLKNIADMDAFATDYRMYVFNPMDDINQFPFTIVYDYEIKKNTLVNIPDWSPVYDYDIEVRKSTRRLICKVDKNIRYIELNNAPKASVSNIDKKITYTWSLKDFLPLKEEIYSPNIDAIAPMVLIAPANVSYNKFENKFDNWEDFGLWIAKLNYDRDTLPIEIKNKLIDLTKNETTLAAKTDKVYKYLQSITRYISIQFGIGGLQPQYAYKTIELGYGDCKALSMLMVAMLKAININAYYTLVLAGENENIFKEFPSNQFNHVIVCVPNNKDTIWLECTSQKNKFNYLSDFTDDRDVLVIAEKPFITHTKVYNENNNTTNTIGKINIDVNGNANCNLIVKSTYLNADYFYAIESTTSQKEKEKLITNYFNFKNINIDSYSFSDDDAILPKISFNANITSRNYATVAGKRLFIPLNRFHTFYIPFDSDSIRNFPFVLYHSRKYVDSIEFEIPDGYNIESKNTTYKIESKCGSYEYNITVAGKNVMYARQLIVLKGSYQPEDFQSIKSYFKEIYLKDGISLIVKKEN